MKNVLEQKLQTESNHTFYVRKRFIGNRAVCEIMWKNIVKTGRPQITILLMLIAWWIPKTTNTHSDCVKHIAFPLQQWLYEGASMSHNT